VSLPNKQPLLLTDTVGFVRKLPHQLVESFNATLEEAALADFLIHLLDASQPEVIEFYNTTMKVLAELKADARPMIVAFNKIDAVSDPAVLMRLRHHFPDALYLSVLTGEGMEALLARMGELVAAAATVATLFLPHAASHLAARLHEETRVIESEYTNEGVRLVALLPPRLAERYAAYIVEAPGQKTADPDHLLQTN
jgi:GTP-binding protein HflX